MHSLETIVAISTPIGEGGISVIRISGPQAISVADRGFQGKGKLSSVRSHTAHLGEVRTHSKEWLDDVLAIVYRGPNSYTGEDTVEINCHGGLFVTRKVLEAFLGYGARHAEPGEFTKRAFLNGRMDLAQAEAVADLIHASSELSHQTSLRQLKGDLSREISALRENLIQTAGLLELELDFVEEGLEFADKGKVNDQLLQAGQVIERLISTYRTGRVYRDGIKVVLAGMPNVGKSSLLNALIKQDRAIVTEVPGTTRDTIEEGLRINGMMFRVVDTAGIRETSDRVEQEGVRRSQDEIRTGDILLLVLDAAGGIEEGPANGARDLVNQLKRTTAGLVVAMNKIDLVPERNGRLSQAFEAVGAMAVVPVSALTGEGIENLEKKLYDAAAMHCFSAGESGVIVTNSRHYDALGRAHKSLQRARQSVSEGRSGEFVSVDLRASLDALGEIIGVVTTDDILNAVFSRFCIGK